MRNSGTNWSLKGLTCSGSLSTVNPCGFQTYAGRVDKLDATFSGAASVTSSMGIAAGIGAVSTTSGIGAGVGAVGTTSPLASVSGGLRRIPESNHEETASVATALLLMAGSNLFTEAMNRLEPARCSGACMPRAAVVNESIVSGCGLKVHQSGSLPRSFISRADSASRDDLTSGYGYGKGSL